MVINKGRRKFLGYAGLSTSGILFGNALSSWSAKDKIKGTKFNLMEEVQKYRKIDAHAHVGFKPGDVDEQIDFADRLGIDKMCISNPITNYSGKEPEDPSQVKANNDVILKAMKRHPDRFFGYLTLNPRYQKESLQEIERCVDQGVVGYKGYTQVKINDPLYFPIIEKFVDLKMTMLMHAFVQIGVGGYRMKYDKGQAAANTTIPEDMAEVAKRYPEGIFQFAHIGGGGDCEYACKILKDYKNVYVDTAGSNNEEYMINFALEHLGEDRLLFGCDGSYYQGVGKILAADLTETQRKKIFYDNCRKLLNRSGNHVD